MSVIKCIQIFFLLLTVIDVVRSQKFKKFSSLEVPTNSSALDDSGGSYGCDYSTLLSVDVHRCIAQYAKFVVPRGFRSTGTVDPNVCSNLINPLHEINRSILYM